MKEQLLLLTFMLALLTAYSQQVQSPLTPLSHETTPAQFPESSGFANSTLTYKIIDAPNKTFCYDVYAEGRLMIHQTSVPGLPGNKGFKTKDDAVKVAELVIDKIRKGEMPPTVSIDEMKKLNVIK